MYLSKTCDTIYVSELNCAFIKWKEECSGDDFKKPLLHAIEILDSNRGSSLIFDMRDAFKVREDDEAWMFSSFCELAEQAGCADVFLISNEHTMLEAVMENTSAFLSRYFRVHRCENFDDIKLILLSRI